MSGQGLGTAWRGQGMPADNQQTGNLLSQMARQGLKAALVHFPESIAAGRRAFQFCAVLGKKHALGRREL
ncbi:MAG: hypothetical protein ACR5LG_01275 [Sodalis sp. (in: enterobacteria)]|uniref:hypothetical protein n=1 Tax=Sodalis sp. (in: enterobacteria) TaxID=1898979 RepID=UPI003F33802B